RSSFDWYQANDPRPNYYKNLPSFYLPTAKYDPENPTSDASLEYLAQLEQYEYMVDLWKNDENVRQIDWDGIYQTNLRNNIYYDRDPELRGQSSYILKNEHQNQSVFMVNTYLNHRFNDIMTLQAGASFNYTNAHYFQTVKDLLGGEFWRDVDNFSERDFAGDQDKLQNDMRNPNRRVTVGDIYGYNYNIHISTSRLWAQNEINTNHWNINYAVEMSHTDFYRDGQMQNGRAPENSYGKGLTHVFTNGGVKAGATYKINGRNYITGHIAYGTRAPLVNNAYVNARIKDTAVGNLRSEEYVGADLSYTWNYNRFRGSLTGYWNETWKGMQQLYFYDYDLATMMAYTLKNINSRYMGLELGMQYKIIDGLTTTVTATINNYTYNNNPVGVRSAQNGAMDDVIRTSYLKGYHSLLNKS
ncbi:MAG: TonB-dependent receptor, partial [Muribaculaceae bacterium]|nr:TonB-dependent receptor [Muribaculaceae bacterium]